MFGFNKKKNKESEKVSESKVTNSVLASPIKGELVKLETLSDAAFASGVLGKGVAIIPAEGKVFAPIDGSIVTIMDTKHAIAIVSNDGIEMLIHIGMDTVELGGKFFKTHVSSGNKVKRGQLLITFDIEQIKAAGYKTETPIVITNSDNYNEITIADKTTIDPKEDLITVK